MAKNEHIQSVASEFGWDEEKLIKKITSCPDIEVITMGDLVNKIYK